MNKLGKKILYDTLGVLLILLSGLVGWIPGPGGIPFLLAGFGLLAVHHDWAKNILHKIKHKGTSLYSVVFPDNQNIYLLYDIIGIVIISLAMYVILLQTGNIVQTLAIFFVFLSCSLLLANRKRLERITNFAKRLAKRKH